MTGNRRAARGRGAWWLAVATLLAGCQCEPDEAAVSSRPGAQVYERYCALCHGENAEGHAADNAPALSNEEFLRVVDNRFLEQTIKRGRPGTAMAAFSTRFGGPLDDAAVREIIGFLRSFQGGSPYKVSDQPIPGDVQRGAAVYAQSCQECHGAGGEGGTGPNLANPVFLELASDAYIRTTIDRGRPGTPMEAFGGQLRRDQMNDLTALIRSWEVSPAEPTDDGSPPPTAADLWADLGTEDIINNPQGRDPRFGVTADAWYVPADGLHRELSAGAKHILLDARPMSAWLTKRLPGSWPVPFYADESFIERIPSDGTWVVVYCACPHAAADRVARRLRERGVDHVAVLDEGIRGWERAGYEVVTGPPAPPHAEGGGVGPTEMSGATGVAVPSP